MYDRNIIGTSSEIFGYLRQFSVIFGKCSENVRRRSPSLRNNFGKSSEIFGKWSEICGKSSKTSLLECLYNKQNNTSTLGDMEFIFECSHRYRKSERSERVRYRWYMYYSLFLHHQRVYRELTIRAAPNWLNSSVDRALHQFSRSPFGTEFCFRR